MLALLLLFSARVQIAQAHYGVQRIATYIRVMHEKDNPELNWETASYHIRLASQTKQEPIWNISPFSPLDALLLLFSIIANIIALVVSTKGYKHDIYVCVAISVVWAGFWLNYQRKVKDLSSMKADQAEEKYWHEFKEHLSAEHTKEDIELKLHSR